MVSRSLVYPGTALYFGTFNPIHAGHLIIAQAVLNQFGEAGIHGVTFIPAGNPPHRHAEPDLLDARRRLAMVRLATGTHPDFQVSDIELQRAAGRNDVSYTVDTLRLLVAEHGMQPPVPLIIGSDALGKLAGWREPEALIELAYFLQAPRPEYPPVESLMIGKRELPLRTQMIDMPMLAISAVWIRRALRSSACRTEALRYMLPEPVRQYIRENHLYTRSGI